MTLSSLRSDSSKAMMICKSYEKEFCGKEDEDIQRGRKL